MLSWNIVCTSAGLARGAGRGVGLTSLTASAARRMALRAALAMRAALVVGRASFGRLKPRKGSGSCTARAAANFFMLAAMVIDALQSVLTAPRWGGPFVVKTTCTGKDGRGQCLTGTRSVLRGRRHPRGGEGPGNPKGLALRPDGLAGTTNRDVWFSRSWHAAVRALVMAWPPPRPSEAARGRAEPA